MMDDLIRRGDFLSKLQTLYMDTQEGWDRNAIAINVGITKAIHAAQDAPAVDAVEVVRCKDCKWSDWYKSANGGSYCYCMETGASGREEQDYCSYGERREEGLYESLKRGLEEAIAFENGEIECRTETREDGDGDGG